MSGICGIYRRNGDPVDPEQFDGMMDSLRRRGPDGEAVWRNEAVALGCQLLYTTQESKYENFLWLIGKPAWSFAAMLVLIIESISV